MDFYELLSRYYDDIFPVSDAKLQFFLDNLTAAGAKRVLDVACGSGLLARKLAEKGYDVTGVDLESNMIAEANEKAAEEHVTVKFVVGDMRELGRFRAEFDAAICVGNSLAHLLTAREIQSTLGGFHRVIRPGGSATIQIINFDRILALGATELPDIRREDKGFSFYRTYVPSGPELVQFKSRLLTLDDGRAYESEITLRAIRRQELAAWMETAGFTNLQFYGGFDKRPYTPDSYATVVVADKAQ